MTANNPDAKIRPAPWEEDPPAIPVSRPVVDLLLSSHLNDADVVEILSPFGFQDIKRADENLQLIAEDPRAREILAGILETLLSCLARSPDPDQALNFLERFCRAALNRIHLLSYLSDSPWTLWLLARVFGSSPFLAEGLIRNPSDLYWVSNPENLRRGLDKVRLAKELDGSLGRIRTVERQQNILRILKRRQMLLIGVRDLLRIGPVEETARELSDLADILIKKACDLAGRNLRSRFGRPLPRAGAAGKEDPAFVVIGMGKLGGHELNFSSDVDLIYFCDPARGKTSGVKGGKNPISNEEYFKRLGEDLTAYLSALTNEGNLFRVDLRLRPEGEAGPIVQTVKEAFRYYSRRGRTWERLAYIKARPVAGSVRLGNRFLSRLSSFVYAKTFTPGLLAEVGAVKAKIDRKMALKKESRRNVKLGTGGIREVEFIVQSLQVFFGEKIPAIRSRNTLDALRRLGRAGILSPDEAGTLSAAYIFLRDVEHKLQMVHEEQTHTLPTDPAEIRKCALRMGKKDGEGIPPGERFLAEYRGHAEKVNGLFRGMFGGSGESEISPIIRRAIEKSGMKKRFGKK